MSVPYAIRVEVAFDDPPLVEADAGPPEVPFWYDVSEFVRGEINTRRGRSSEFDQIEAGTATFTLTNSNRRFDPDNASGIYYGTILPGRKVRISAMISAVRYYRFTGFIRSWNVEYLSGLESIVHVKCVDGFKYLNGIYLTASLSQALTSDRITTLLDAGSPGTVFPQVWPTSDRDIATGAGTVEAEDVKHQSFLSHIQMATNAEQGLFFIAGNGDATFQNRTHRDSPSSEATFSNKVPPDADDLPYKRLVVTFDDSTLWNQVEVTRSGGIRQTAADFDSMDDYMRRVYSPPSLVLVDDAAALDAAKLLLVRYKEPQTRPQLLEVNPQAVNGAATVEDAYAEVLEREISDPITVKRTTLLDGNEMVWECYIERIEDLLTVQQWIVTFTLSPVITATDTSTDVLNTTDDWIVPTLLNSWVDYGLGRPALGYRKEGDWVYLRGTVKNGSPVHSKIFALPVGYRPPADLVFTVDSDGAYGQLLIEAGGDVFSVVGTNTAVSLDGINFRVI